MAKYDYVWCSEAESFVVTIDGQPSEFVFAAKSKWDRSGAETLAKKKISELKLTDYEKDKAERQAKIEAAPLSSSELRWLELHRKLINAIRTKTSISEEELHLYELLGQTLRRSLSDKTHPAVREIEQ